jgi:hypothetical protein
VQAHHEEHPVGVHRRVQDQYQHPVTQSSFSLRYYLSYEEPTN